jgi:hypothetical protein
MTEYRAYTVGTDGRFNGYEPLICVNDSETIENTKRLSGQYPVEL